MKTYTNGLLHASGDLEEYTVTKTDESGTARSETCTVSPEDVRKEADQSKAAIPSESATVSNGSAEQ